jgi:hypothetical protein
MSTALDELTRRVTDLADRHQRDPDPGFATDLYEVERSLRTASRRLAALVRATRSVP